MTNMAEMTKKLNALNADSRSFDLERFVDTLATVLKTENKGMDYYDADAGGTYVIGFADFIESGKITIAPKDDKAAEFTDKMSAKLASVVEARMPEYKGNVTVIAAAKPEAVQGPKQSEKAPVNAPQGYGIFNGKKSQPEPEVSQSKTPKLRP